MQNNLNIMNEQNMQKVSSKQKVMKILVKVGLYGFLSIMGIIVIFPFYWMIISSLKSFTEYNLITPTFWPKSMAFSNYVRAFSSGGLGRLFFNTIYVGIVSTLLSLVVTILAAFAFARLEFKGRDAIFGAMLATMMIPGELFTITNYGTMNGNFLMFHFDFLDFSNSYTALIVPFLVSVFYIYLLRQNFKQIPNELYLAAKVDGTNDFKYLWKVMIPLAAPSLVSITILKMMGSWNSYVWPRLINTDKNYQLITNGIRSANYVTDGGLTDFPVQMAFIFFRKYIMKGVSRSGIKG